MNIALFLPNWIGDAVMATPAIRAVRRQFPDAHLTGILKPYVAGVLEGAPWFNSLLFQNKSGPWSQKWFSVAHTLRKQRPDIAILFPNSFRSGLISWLSGSKRRVGYNRYGRRFLLTDCLEPIRDQQGKILPSPIIDAYNLLVKTIGCSDPGYQMELFTTKQDEKAADEVWESGKIGANSEIICLNPGAAYGAAKHWPTEYFALLAQKLVDERGSAVLVLCGPKEADLAKKIAFLARRSEIHTLADHRQSIG